jgi:sugar fermentation stimulation protein A
MQLPRPLYPGTLLKRYKRFLADVVLDDGTELTAHCPNPGRMTGLMTPGSAIWLSRSDNPKRKLPFTFELYESANGLVGINTGYPNIIVSQAIAREEITELSGYESLRREVNYGERSRIDVLLEDSSRGKCWVEIKNVHLKRDKDALPGIAEFPDSVTARGTRHLYELSNQVANGDRAVMVYLVQRMDCDRFRVAADIDPVYAKALAYALKSGVEVLCFDTTITTNEIKIRRALKLAFE